jgi:hypothetical protein
MLRCTRLRAMASAALAMAALAACSEDPAAPSSSNRAPAAATDRTEVAAPIESAELIVSESLPVRYAVRVTSGLPSGCAKFERIDIARNGNVVNLKVWNTLPADPAVACTMIYGTAQHTAELGTGFARGEAYEVHVNGEPRLVFTPE